MFLLCLLCLEAWADPPISESVASGSNETTSASSVTQSLTPVEPDPLTPKELVAPRAPGGRRSELVGFTVQGRRRGQRLVILDLDSIVTAEEIRVLPLLRLLQVFQIEITEGDGQIAFVSEGVGDVIVDLDREQIQIKDKTKPVFYLEATSIITMKRDLYLTPEIISEILGIELEWDNALYEYRAKVERTLNIWRREKRASLLATRALYVPPDMPEVHPPAKASTSLLHFLELTWRPSFQWDPSTEENEWLALPSPQQTLWGNLAGGRYKLQLSERGAQWDHLQGLHWAQRDEPAVTVGWAELLYRLPGAEVAVGDSSFGLGELIFPFSQMTGVRFNGLVGFKREELESDRSNLGFHTYFSRPYEFEGNAPIGSIVELRLNDRVIDSQEVFLDKDAPPGFGTYLFEDVRLPGGILNEIVIVVTEPNGIQTRIEKDILGTPSLLPKGRSAYLGILGTRRSFTGPTQREFDIGDVRGAITAGRALFGLTDRLTMGAMFGFQHEFYHPELEDSAVPGQRSHPRSSSHVAGQFSWLALDQVLLSGDMAASQGQGLGGYDDLALRMKGQFFPTDKLSFTMDILNLGSDYFDGQNVDLADRRGGELSTRWRPHRKWSLEAAAGHVRDNLDGQLSETLAIDYQSMRIRTTAIPRTSLTFDFSRFEPNWTPLPKTLGKLSIRSTPVRGLDVFGQVLVGDDLDLGGHHDFFSGLKLLGVPNLDAPMVYASIRKSLPKGNSVSVSYFRSENDEAVSISHDLNIRLKQPLRIHTELLADLYTDSEKERYEFRHRLEYFLDNAGRSSVGLSVQRTNGQWQAMAFLNIRDLYSHHKGRLIRSKTRRVRADYGAVHGVVFLDYNANARQDQGEPGVPDVLVRLGKLYAAVTDKKGYYILSGLSASREVRIFLDVDTIPAIYSPTHGTQLAHVLPGNLTEVNLSVTPLISITGRVVAEEPDERAKPISGIRVLLTDPQTDRFVADSITSEDGSYYLGDIRPGAYILQVDSQTLPPKYHLPESKRELQVTPTKDFQELKMSEFVITTEGQDSSQKEGLDNS